jgi:oxalate decarboxylase
MAEVTRRGLFGTAAVAAGGLVGQALLGQPAAAGEQAKEGDKEGGPKASTHKFRLEASAPQVYAGGSIKEVTVSSFPIAREMSGASVLIEPGGVREPHWHPNADEWGYFIKGRARMTIVSPKNQKETVEFAAGDVSYVPRGFGHYVENIGDEECHIILVFNNGEFDQIGITGWVANTPRHVLGTTFGVPGKTFAGFPRQEVHIAGKRVSGRNEG